MTPSNNKIYLGKSGKIYGPFTRAEVEAFQDCREIEKYTFIWDTTQETWIVIESPPPPLEGKASAQGEVQWSDLKVICHDFTHLVSGTLEDITETGCHLHSLDPSDYPVLGLKTRVILNLMDPKSEKSISVEAIISHIERYQNSWIYRLSWKERPKLRSSS